jgi:glutamine amidotransferase
LTEVLIIKTGIANLASVKAGLARAGAEVVVSSNPEEIKKATHAVLPGVGNFSAGMKCLRDAGLEAAIKYRFENNLPTLAICLGLQMLFEQSEEDNEEKGLGIVPGKVKKFSSKVRVPQLGWNYVTASDNSNFIKPGYAYFANSYKATSVPKEWSPALCNYDGEFVAAFEKGPLLAMQFHPELSGQWGLDILKRWVCSQ